MDFITRQQREELNALSKEVFGKSSFWYNKLYKTGVKRTFQEATTIKQAFENGDLRVSPNKSDWRYFKGYEDIKEYVLTIQKNSKELLEKMKAEGATANVSK